jgi:hypothetical protein
MGYAMVFHRRFVSYHDVISFAGSISNSLFLILDPVLDVALIECALAI